MRLAPLIATAQACARDALEAGAPFITFTPREGVAFDAFAARIIPSDDTPGAREAGVAYFADHALADVLSELLPIVRTGLAALDERVSAAFPGEGTFAELSEARQDALVSEIETGDAGFFYFARMLVMLGLVTHPGHGGNRDGVGWQLVGFEDRFAYQPPFGYYDRDEHGPRGGGAE